MILQTENLTIVRNQQAVISDLNFTLADIEKVVLQGEIGSGKSSFLLALLGFVPLASGSLYWFGQKCEKEARFCANSWASSGDLLSKCRRSAFRSYRA